MMRPEVEPDAAAVAELEACWERLLRAHAFDAEEELHSLLEEWKPHRAMDPIALETDLLSPLGQEFNEPAHTQAIASLLATVEGRSLGTGPLEIFLEAVLMVADETTPGSAQPVKDHFRGVLARFGGKFPPVSVQAERASVLVDLDGEKRPKTDLRLELPAREPALLLVIENKVGDVARPGQLARYEAAVARRVAQLGTKPIVVKVYLTPWGDPPSDEAGGSNWLPLSYYRLATAWTQLLTPEGKGGATEFLRLYLATVLQKVLDVSDRPGLSRAERTTLASYLRARLRGQP